jgi:hypothetical protein
MFRNSINPIMSAGIPVHGPQVMNARIPSTKETIADALGEGEGGDTEG